MKFTKMCCIHGLVTEYAIDGEITGWFETSLLICKFVEHLRRNGGGVCSEKVLERLFSLEIITVSNRASPSLLVHFLHSFIVILGNTDSRTRLLDEKGIMCISRGVTLRLEQGIKVPERTLHPLVGRHFLESHLHQNLTEFGPNLEKRMKVSSSYLFSNSKEVVRFERSTFPRSRIKHFFGQISCLLDTFGSIFSSSGDRVGFQCN
mmetsp:Transcript_19612/g.28953  ORF Transcript_19612/g.28953 Transcript_19612/m.28953 type:complete len:206 (-) Transcript_19612:604-1221(-)